MADQQPLSFYEFIMKFNKIQFAIIKKLAVESQLNTSMIREILASVKNANLDELKKEYQKRYEAEMVTLKSWIFQNMGVDDIDWDNLFGYNPL